MFNYQLQPKIQRPNNDLCFLSSHRGNIPPPKVNMLTFPLDVGLWVNDMYALQCPCGPGSPGIISSIPTTKMRIKQQVRKMDQYQRSFDLIFLRYTVPKIKSIFSLKLYIVLLQYLSHEVDDIVACWGRGETSSQHALWQYVSQVNSVKDPCKRWCLCFKWHCLVH